MVNQLVIVSTNLIKIISEESLWWLVARALAELHERSCSALAIFLLFGSPPQPRATSANNFDYDK